MSIEQHIASDPAISAWVSASAGTGKTKVLTDRVLRLLLSGTPPAKILCITYTKAASAEMEGRIEKQLGRWAIAEDKDLQKSLTELTGKTPDAKTLTRARRLFAHVLDSPERIRIQTIHSFCQSVLARFPLEANVPPHFTLIDEHTARELLATARTRLFSDDAADNLRTNAIRALATLINEDGFNELIKSIVTDRRKFNNWFEDESGIEKLRAHIYKKLGVEENTTPEALIEKHFRYTAEELSALRKACEALAQGTKPTDMQTHAALSYWLEERKHADAYVAALITQAGTPRKTVATNDIEKYLPGIKELLQKEQQRVLAFFSEQQSLGIAQMSTHAAVLAHDLLHIYHELKAQRGYMDYDDLILKTMELLTRKGVASWVLYKLDGGIDHLLVDEAQDTSPEQWQIIEALAAEFFTGQSARATHRTIFIVGDEKQSIYSFQGADPLAFDAVQKRLSKRIVAAEKKYERVRLALSFRSTAAVLQAVDAVFANPTARAGLVFGEQDISHDVHRKGAAGRVEFWPLDEAPTAEDLPAWHIPEKPIYGERPEVITAHRIADTIDSWLKEKRQLPSQARAITAGDILILVQRRGKFADVMLRALKQRGIAVAGADRLVLTEHIAVQDCMALANFLLLPQDDLTLATVLKSPFVGLSEEALFTLAYDRKKQSLWQRLKENMAYKDAYDFLSGLLAKVDYLPPHELLVYVLESAGGRNKLAKRLGAEIDDPLNEFLALALEYGRIHTPSLQGFLQWLSTGATEIKRDMEKGAASVRIMTVHGAKGLQAPIVFLPDTTRTPKYDSGMLWSDDAQMLPLWSPMSEYDDMHYRALKEQRRLEAQREYRRLLYVAMTRSEDELYICGWKGSKGVNAECWYELIKQAADLWPQMDGLHVLDCPQTSEVKILSLAAAEVAAASLPDWARKAAPPEALPLKPLTPSRMEERENTLSPIRNMKARERGILIHRLLQYLPDAAVDARTEILQRFIAHHGNDFTSEEQVIIANEVMAILAHPDFAPVFGSNSVVEAPISGIVADGDGKPVVISGQIDRLAVVGNDVYIIDYKTNREVPKTIKQVPKAYLRQMDAYRTLVSRIYPQKTVYCALLWTAAPRLMVLPNAIMTSLTA